MYDIVIIGAGLYGLTIARLAKEEKLKPLILEKSNHLGGLCYTSKFESCDVHEFGPHIFHTSMAHVWNFVNQFTEFNNFVYEPIAFSKGKAYNLPINLNTMNQIFGTRTPEEAQKVFNNEKGKYSYIKEPQNLEEQALVLMGETLYNTLVKEYTEKQWGRECKDLPPSIIKRMVIRNTYSNDYYNDKYQGIPYIGYTQMMQNMANGIEIKYNTFITLKELKQFNCPIIYTGPIDQLYNYWFGKLDYLRVKYEKQIYKINNKQGVAVINHIDKNIPYQRSIEHNFFNPKLVDKTIVSYEYFDKNSDIIAYPIQDKRNVQIYNKYLTILDKNIIPAGRLGLYKYLDMDDTIAAAMEMWEEKFLNHGNWVKETEHLHL